MAEQFHIGEVVDIVRDGRWLGQAIVLQIHGPELPANERKYTVQDVETGRRLLLTCRNLAGLLG